MQNASSQRKMAAIKMSRYRHKENVRPKTASCPGTAYESANDYIRLEKRRWCGVRGGGVGKNMDRGAHYVDRGAAGSLRG